GIPTLIFLLAPKVPWDPDHIDDGKRGERRIDALRAELEKEKLVSYFRDPGDLAARVTAALAQVVPPAPPRKRIVGVRPSDEVEFFKDRVDEADQLRRLLGDRAVKFVCVTGRGGVGKTALLSKVCAEVEEGRLRLSKSGNGMGADGILYVSCRGADRPTLGR